MHTLQETSLAETQPDSPRNPGEVLVKVENVGKIFCRDFKKSLLYGLKDSMGDLFCSKNQIDPSERPLRPGEFWANRNISFELRRGECLGLIGHNGAGKTTLLKMLNGLIKPDVGSIEMRGRVGALIALGAGFNPILTGRENIYVNASILGLSKKQVDKRIESIIDFAEIREFIDSPVQTYSSGMQVRLGFSIATTLEPDILILDEVLAVGDASFRAKCAKRIRTIQKECAIIFVSHNIEQITSITNCGYHLSKGQGKFFDTTRGAIESYFNESNSANIKSPDASLITDDSITNVKTEVTLTGENNDSIHCEISFTNNSSGYLGYARLCLFSLDGRMVWESNGRNSDESTNIKQGKNAIAVEFSEADLKNGIYLVDLFLFARDDNQQLIRSHLQHKLTIASDRIGYADTITSTLRYRTGATCP